MLEDAGRKFILDFDGGGVKKRKNQVKIQKEIAKKIHVGIQYPDQIFQEEKMYIIASYKLWLHRFGG